MAHDHETLRIAGVALYGPSWQTDLADALHVNLRTMQRWASGASPVRDSIWADIAGLCRQRGAKLTALAKTLQNGSS